MKIIQIDGIRGLITALFIVVCLAAGFVVFPGFVAMHYWNKYLVNLYMFPSLNLFQGILLWAIAAISYMILTKRDFAVSFKNSPELSDDELDMILKKARVNTHMRMMNNIMSKADKFKFSKKDSVKASQDKDNSFVASSFSINKSSEPAEKAEDEKVSNIK